jgi:release factor glutamine methyltransferase
MKTLGEVLTLATGYLRDKGVERARRSAEDLLAHHLQLKRLDLYMKFDQPMQEQELDQFRASIARRGKGEPVEYVLQEIEFFGCSLEITSDVLIPRPETELLLERICKAVTVEKIAWDLCTGSGCLGIGLKKKCPQLAVTLSDLSPQALSLAKKNACRNQVEVECLEGDLLAPFVGRKADLVIVNPPYITQEEYDSLSQEVKQFEPKMALLAGPTGLEFYARLAEELPNYLTPRARVFFEIGAGQGASVEKLFSANHWRIKSLDKDYSGHDRFFFLEFE